MNVIKSNKVYNPQDYVEILTGNYYCFEKDDTTEEIHKLLKQNGIESEISPIFDYPLDEIDVAIDSETNVVLVDVSYVDENYCIVPEYRWFEVPDDFLEKEMNI